MAKKTNSNETEQSLFVRIPEDRLGALIGKQGIIKREIEKKMNVKLVVDSADNEVEIQKRANTDAFDFLITEKMIKAIARGFSWQKAKLLANEEFDLDLIDLKDLFGKSEKRLQQKKARIIGTEGKARERIENETNCFVSVYGHTIGLIGKQEDLPKAKKAIEMLLEGASHTSTYKFLATFEKSDKENDENSFGKDEDDF